MNPMLRLLGTVVVITVALAVLVPLLCQLVAVAFPPIIVIAVLVMLGRVIWYYTQ